MASLAEVSNITLGTVLKIHCVAFRKIVLDLSLFL